MMRSAWSARSCGDYLGAILTTLRPVRWLALRAPALYKDSDWTTPKSMLRTAQKLEVYRTSKVAAASNRALAACAAFNGDVLLVESAEDTIIPHPVIESYREACHNARSLTYRVIEKADHALSDPRAREAYSALLVNWITEMIAGVRAPDAEGQRLMRQGMKAQATAAESG